jgi:3-oxoacyl-(acyl-carrier-protein) synthase
MSTPRIFITGTGAVCGSGNSSSAIFDALREGRSSIAPIRMWDTSGWPVKVAAEIADFNPRAMVEDRKLHKFIRRTDMLGFFAGSQAIEAAGFTAHRESLAPDAAATYSDRSGCYVGSGGGAYNTQYEFFPLMTEAGGDLVRFGEELSNVVNPMWLLRTLPNNVLCHVGIKYNLKGTNACITNHSCGGALAVIEAAEALRTGEADRAVAIGHDTLIEPQMVLYYHACGLLAAETIRPFDRARDGSLFGEGAGALALETEASVRERGATVIGEVLGGGHAG